MESTPQASRTLAAVMLALLGVLLVMQGLAVVMVLNAGLGSFTVAVVILLVALMTLTIGAVVSASYKFTNAHRHALDATCQCATCGATFRAAGPKPPKPPTPRPSPRERQLSAMGLLAGGPVMIVGTLVGLGWALLGSVSWLVTLVLAVGLILGVVALVAGLRMSRAARKPAGPHHCTCRWCGASRA